MATGLMVFVLLNELHRSIWINAKAEDDSLGFPGQPLMPVITGLTGKTAQLELSRFNTTKSWGGCNDTYAHAGGGFAVAATGAGRDATS
jgi:hypothetical protein